METGVALSLIMFAIFLVLILIGYNVAFSFASTALLFSFIGNLTGTFDPNTLNVLPARWFGAVSDPTLLAVPFFFSQMERWQVCGYWIGLGLYLANIVVLHSLLLGVVAFTVHCTEPPMSQEMSPTTRRRGDASDANHSRRNSSVNRRGYASVQ